MSPDPQKPRPLPAGFRSPAPDLDLSLGSGRNSSCSNPDCSDNFSTLTATHFDLSLGSAVVNWDDRTSANAAYTDHHADNGDHDNDRDTIQEEPVSQRPWRSAAPAAGCSSDGAKPVNSSYQQFADLQFYVKAMEEERQRMLLTGGDANYPLALELLSNAIAASKNQLARHVLSSPLDIVKGLLLSQAHNNIQLTTDRTSSTTSSVASPSGMNRVDISTSSSSYHDWTQLSLGLIQAPARATTPTSAAATGAEDACMWNEPAGHQTSNNSLHDVGSAGILRSSERSIDTGRDIAAPPFFYLSESDRGDHVTPCPISTAPTTSGTHMMGPKSNHQKSTCNPTRLNVHPPECSTPVNGLKSATINNTNYAQHEASMNMSNGTSPLAHQINDYCNGTNQAPLPAVVGGRKPRRSWTPNLHRKFLMALRQLGGPNLATPNHIREVMNVEGLTNVEVKSHLQKYRLHASRNWHLMQRMNAT